MAFLEIETLKKNFGKERVLNGIDFSMDKGELAVIVGASGCGKTTFLRILAGLDHADSGKILLDGKDITGTEPGKRGIGMVFQKYSLFPNMTVRENIGYGLRVKGCSSEEILKKTDEMLEIVHLTGKADAYPAAISGGQQQRTAFARAMVVNPQILLLDEPFSALDAELRKELRDEFKRIQRDTGLTAVLVTHDQEEAMLLADKIHVMNKGMLEQSGTPEEVYMHPKTLYAASFMGECNIIPSDLFNKAAGCKLSADYAVIRNENILLKDKACDEPDSVLIPAVITESIFCGKTVKYEFASSDMKLKAERPAQENCIFKKGDKVTVIIKRDQVIGLDR